MQAGVALLAVFSKLAMAAPSSDPSFNGYSNNSLTSRGAAGWAYFCTDMACSEGCTENWVSISNPGCISGSYGSFKNKRLAGDYTLVISPSEDCPCQSHRISGLSDDYDNDCIDISKYNGQSFRFIHGGGGDDNC